MRLLLLLGLLAPASAALASPIAPPDTLPGHHRLVRSISTALCAELTASQAPNLTKLPTSAVMDYAQGLFTRAMLRDSVQLQAMMQAAAAQGVAPVEVSRLLGRDAMVEAVRDCPAARPLALRFAQTEQGQQAIAAQQPTLPPAEQKALQPLVSALCAELGARNARTPFSKLTAAGRRQVFVSALQKAFKPQTDALNRFYGPAKLDALLRSGKFDGRVASLMLRESPCSQYVLLLGQDRIRAGAGR